MHLEASVDARGNEPESRPREQQRTDNMFIVFLVAVYASNGSPTAANSVDHGVLGDKDATQDLGCLSTSFQIPALAPGSVTRFVSPQRESVPAGRALNALATAAAKKRHTKTAFTATC